MTSGTSLVRALLGRLEWRAALRSPRTWQIVARHLIPVAGVIGLGWSGAQAIALVALDTLAGLWCIVAAASVLVARETWYAKTKDLTSAIVGGLLVFAIVAGLMTFVVGVIAFVLYGSVIQSARLDLRELLVDGWIWWAFGGLLLLQAPHFLTLVSTTTEATAKSVFEPRVGYLLRRLILAALACSFLSFLSGPAALIAALLVTQLVLAAHEVFGEELHAVLFPQVAKDPASPPVAKRRRRRRR